MPLLELEQVSKSFGGLPFMPTIDGTILPLRPIEGVRSFLALRR